MHHKQGHQQRHKPRQRTKETLHTSSNTIAEGEVLPLATPATTPPVPVPCFRLLPQARLASLMMPISIATTTSTTRKHRLSPDSPPRVCGGGVSEWERGWLSGAIEWGSFALLLGGLGDLAGSGLLLGHLLDDTHGHRHAHVAHGETSQGRVVREGLDAHGLLGDELHHGGVARLDGLGLLLQLLARSAVHLGADLSELAGDVGRVAVQHGRIAVLDLTGVVQNDDLSDEVLAAHGGVVLGVGGNVAPLELLDRHVLDVEANVVAGGSLGQRLVVHLNRLDLSRQVHRGERHNHAGFEDTGFDTSDGDGADTADLVHVLERQPEGLVGRTLGRLHLVQRLKQSRT
mmetsp:Transcript_22038/g.62821  ORF Transcript_22038/g.62821 Transcript_22038/m.62821 type:complete len:345 (-) Transcript_22038:137-1171(-)